MLAWLLLLVLAGVAVTAGKCPAGTIQGLSDDCYVYRSKPELWFAADEDCMSRGGHLASVSNRLVNSFLAAVSDHYCASEHWLGAGYNTEADDEWVWTDGRPFRTVRKQGGGHSADGSANTFGNGGAVEHYNFIIFVSEATDATYRALQVSRPSIANINAIGRVTVVALKGIDTSKLALLTTNITTWDIDNEAAPYDWVSQFPIAYGCGT